MESRLFRYLKNYSQYYPDLVNTVTEDELLKFYMESGHTDQSEVTESQSEHN